MTPKIYCHEGSPVSRATLLTIAALGVEVEIVTVSVLDGDNLKPEFLKLNPLHTIPTIEDGDFAIWDSHAINTYLIGKFGKDDSLYPKDLKKRAVIDQRLHFDSGVLFPRLGAIIRPIIREGAKKVNKENAENLAEAYGLLETLLEGKLYVAGDELSVADFSLIATISTANVVVPVAPEKFPNIYEWMNRMEKLPYYSEANQPGLDMFNGFIKSKLAY